MNWIRNVIAFLAGFLACLLGVGAVACIPEVFRMLPPAVTERLAPILATPLPPSLPAAPGVVLGGAAFLCALVSLWAARSRPRRGPIPEQAVPIPPPAPAPASEPEDLPLALPAPPVSDPDRPYEIFVSYARRDNRAPHGQPHWVQAFVQGLNRARRENGKVADYNVYFDESEIDLMEDWELHLQKGLSQSYVLAALVSPRYLASEPCQWEWEQFTEREARLGSQGLSILPVVLEFHEIFPSHGGSPDEASLRAWLSGLPADHPRPKSPAEKFLPRLRRRVEDLLKRQASHHFAPHFPAGWPVLLADATLRERFRAIEETLHARLQQAKALELVDVRTLNPFDRYFVGRRAQLEELATALNQGAGIITAIRGLGGLGKTALANRYGHGNKGRYRGGLFQLPCEGIARLDLALTPLFPDLGIDPALPGDAQVRACVAALEARARAVNSLTLLILDNVSQPELLRNQTLAPLLDSPFLHLLATTRLTGDDLGAGDARRRIIALEELPEDDCVELIRLRQPGERFSSPDEEEAARRIARHLGGFTLAVEAAAIYLGRQERVSCSAFLEWLQRDTLSAVDEAARDPGSQALMAHREKLLGATLAPTIEGTDAAPGLSPAELHVLRVASLFPPDELLADWVRAVAAGSFPELAASGGPGPLTPWDRVLRRLIGLQLLNPREGGTDGDDPARRSLRMHRMVSDWVRGRWDEGERTAAGEELLQFLIGRAGWLEREFDRDPSVGWLQQPLAVTAEHLALRIDPETGDLVLRTPLRREWGLLLDVAAGVALRVASLPRAIELVERALQIRNALHDANPADAQAARDLSVSLNKLGDFFLRRGQDGDASRALEHYHDSLKIAQALHDANPADAQAARDLSVSLERLAMFHAGDQGNLAQASAAIGQALELRRGIAAANPGSAELMLELARTAFQAVQIQFASDPAAARASLELCHRILSGLHQANALFDPRDQAFFQHVDQIVRQGGGSEGGAA